MVIEPVSVMVAKQLSLFHLFLGLPIDVSHIVASEGYSLLHIVDLIKITIRNLLSEVSLTQSIEKYLAVVPWKVKGFIFSVLNNIPLHKTVGGSGLLNLDHNHLVV